MNAFIIIPPGFHYSADHVKELLLRMWGFDEEEARIMSTQWWGWN